MEQSQFMNLMEPGGTAEKKSVDVLREFATEFPYFQTAHALLAKAFSEHRDIRYDKFLKIAAAYSADRKSLYKLIHQKAVPIFSAKEEEKNASPFVLTEEPNLQSVVLNPPVPENSIPENDAVKISVPNPVFKEEPLVITQEDFKQNSQSSAKEDPHEIIRRRLAEILGPKTDEKSAPSTPVEEIQITEPVSTVIQSEIKIEEKVIAPIEEPAIEIVQPEPSATLIVEKQETDAKEVVPTNEERVKQRINEILIQSEKAVDDIDLGELEYALEGPILQSIENLPPLVIEEANEPIEKTPTVQFEKGSFMDWLKAKSTGSFGKVEEVHADEPLLMTSASSILVQTIHEKTKELRPLATDKTALIDKFIATEPRIVASKIEFYSPANQAKKSVAEHEDLVSETLAKIYRQQGNLLKARNCYEKLSLLHPEKKTYFAALITEIDSELNNPEKQDL